MPAALGRFLRFLPHFLPCAAPTTRAPARATTLPLRPTALSSSSSSGRMPSSVAHSACASLLSGLSSKKAPFRCSSWLSSKSLIYCSSEPVQGTGGMSWRRTTNSTAVSLIPMVVAIAHAVKRGSTCPAVFATMLCLGTGSALPRSAGEGRSTVCHEDLRLYARRAGAKSRVPCRAQKI